MKITVESDCALRIMLFLGIRGLNVKTGAKMISEKENIPIRFTLKILRKLKLANMVCSYRGQNGGYALIKETSEVTLKDVIEVIDGPIVMNKCLTSSGEGCDLRRSSICPIHYYLGGIQKEISDKLNEVTLEMLISKYVQGKTDILTQIRDLV